jgi:hypothetical protein
MEKNWFPGSALCQPPILTICLQKNYDDDPASLLRSCVKRTVKVWMVWGVGKSGVVVLVVCSVDCGCWCELRIRN